MTCMENQEQEKTTVFAPAALDTAPLAAPETKTSVAWRGHKLTLSLRKPCIQRGRDNPETFERRRLDGLRVGVASEMFWGYS